MGGEDVKTSLMWNFAPLGTRRMKLYVKRDASSRDHYKTYLMIENYKMYRK